METNADGTYFQEGDHVRLKSTQETGRVHGADGGVVYVLMDETNETRLFSAYVDEDAYIELVVFANGDTALPQISEEGGQRGTAYCSDLPVKDPPFRQR